MVAVPTSADAKCGVYAIVFDNGKMYVGQAVDIRRRFSEHRTQATTNDRYPLYRAMRKHTFTFEILCNCAEGYLNTIETELIERLNSLSPNGYNLREGGSHGRLAPEACAKISLTHKGKPKSPEHKSKISAAQKGRAVPLDRRAKISAALTGRTNGPLSDEHRAKLSRAQTGIPKTAEHRRKLSEANAGKKNGPHSPETKAKIGLAHRGRKQGPLSPEQKARQLAGVRRYQESRLARKLEEHPNGS